MHVYAHLWSSSLIDPTPNTCESFRAYYEQIFWISDGMLFQSFRSETWCSMPWAGKQKPRKINTVCCSRWFKFAQSSFYRQRTVVITLLSNGSVFACIVVFLLWESIFFVYYFFFSLLSNSRSLPYKKNTLNDSSEVLGQIYINRTEPPK